jgi:hypothetical protein
MLSEGFLRVAPLTPMKHCLGNLARYCFWVCSVISGSQGDVVETKGAGCMNEGAGGRVSGGVHSAPACTPLVHTTFQLATLVTTTKPFSHHAPARHLAVAQAHVAAALRAPGCDRSSTHVPRGAGREQAEPRLPRALVLCGRKRWWWSGLTQ